MKKQILTALAFGLTFLSVGQISEGGLPETFVKVIDGETSIFDTDYQVVNLNQPDMISVYAEDAEIEYKHEGYRVAINQPTSISIVNSGTWQNLENGDKIWRVGIKVPKAQGLGLYFSQAVVIPQGGKLFAYNANHSQYIGAYTSNTPSFSSMEIIEGELLTLEYYMPAGSLELPTIEINNVAYFYRGVESRMAAFREGNSTESQIKAHQNCEVDVACSEITGWETQRDGVVRYTFVSGGSTYLCSGSMVNNTNNDCKPYFLTANHCGEPTSNGNITNHTFYFNYQRPTCTPGTTASYNGAQSQTMSGGMLRASSQLGTFNAGANQVSGSDFILIEMNSNVPGSFNAYYSGWDRAVNGSASGVGIHHPAGDEKKISTYSSTLNSATYNGGWSGAHWSVQWVATANGHGVTEGGSSGSPIFNTNGSIVGHLSGGSSFCTSPNANDLYGKFNRAWDQEGNNANQQLKAWLDPTNSNVMILGGTYAPCAPSAPIAEFVANVTAVSPATTINFTDQSSNSPTSWAWTVSPASGWAYAGGTNASSQNPQITFNTVGFYNITLVATNAQGSDSEIKNNYIEVTNNVGPCAATSTNCDEFISNVTFGSINNNSACDNYADFTSQSTTVTQGQTGLTCAVTPQIGVNVGQAYTDDEIAVWIDWNNDGTFTLSERVGYFLVGSGVGSNVFTFDVPANATVGNVVMRVRNSYSVDDGPIDPCGTTQWGEVEDYTVNVQASGGGVVAPIAQFTANQTTAPVNTIITFTDQSTNSPTSWSWLVSPSSGWSYTGGTNASSQNPKMNFTVVGTYSVTLTASNSAGSDSETKTNYINITGVDGIESNELNTISVYPNPTNNLLNINLNHLANKVVSIKLSDVTGRVISTRTNPSNIVQFDLTNESAGVYFITVKSNNAILTKKVIRY